MQSDDACRDCLRGVIRCVDLLELPVALCPFVQEARYCRSRIIARKQRPHRAIDVGCQAPDDLISTGGEAEDATRGGQCIRIGWVEQHPAAGRDDVMLAAGDFSSHLPLERSKGFLALLGEYGIDRSVPGHDHVIGVHERPTQLARDEPADGGLARAHEARQHHVPFRDSCHPVTLGG